MHLSLDITTIPHATLLLNVCVPTWIAVHQSHIHLRTPAHTHAHAWLGVHGWVCMLAAYKLFDWGAANTPQHIVLVPYVNSHVASKQFRVPSAAKSGQEERAPTRSVNHSAS